MSRVMTQCVCRVAAIVFGLTILGPYSAAAQTVMDATTVEFSASGDHDSVATDGTPVVTSYSLDIFPAGGATPSHSVSLGKPTPGTTGLINVRFDTLLATPLVVGTTYELRVTSIGPGGSTISAVSNRFARSGPCASALSATSAALGAAASTGSVNVNVATGCAWTATSGASWLTVTAGTPGNGNGTVSFSAAANTTTSARTGTLSVAGIPFTVTQAAAGCTYAINPVNRTVAAGGETITVNVTAGASCAWTATTTTSWITIVNGASGSGNGSVTLTVAANTGGTQRGTTLAIAGQTFTISQPPSGACTNTIAPQTRTAVATGESVSVTVTSPTGCAWTAASTASWLTVTSGASGSGNGTVALSVAANTATTARTGTATIAGQTFTVNQAAAGCTYAIHPGSRTAAAGGETTTVNVTAGSSCAWTATNSASWVTIANGSSGSGNGSVMLTVAANTGGTARTAAVTIAYQTFTITQPASSSCSNTIAPETRTAASTGESISVAVTAGGSCIWGAASTVTWLIVTGGNSGIGNGTVAVLASGNSTGSTRTGIVNIAGRTLTVTQPAQTGCNFAVSPLSFSAPAAGATTSAAVTAGTGCAWTASSSAAWITVTGGGTGSGAGTVSMSVAANTGATQRSGLVTIAGQVFSVTQAGTSTCSYTVTPTTLSVPAFGLTSALTVGTGAGCSWAPSGVPSWITMSTATRTGSGQLAYTITANTGAAARTATVTINGITVTMTQSSAAPLPPTGFHVVGGSSRQ